jgi:hypothetical protein
LACFGDFEPEIKKCKPVMTLEKTFEKSRMKVKTGAMTEKERKKESV